MEPSRYTGRASYQVTKYLDEVIKPMLEDNKEELGVTAQINV